MSGLGLVVSLSSRNLRGVTEEAWLRLCGHQDVLSRGAGGGEGRGEGRREEGGMEGGEEGDGGGRRDGRMEVGEWRGEEG